MVDNSIEQRGGIGSPLRPRYMPPLPVALEYVVTPLAIPNAAGQTAPQIPNAGTVGGTIGTGTATAPTVANLADGRPVLRVNGSATTDGYYVDGAGAVITTQVFAGLIRTIPTSGFARLIRSAGANNILSVGTDGAISLFGSSTLTGGKVTAGTPFIAIGQTNGATSSVRVNGASVTGNAGTASGNDVYLGVDANAVVDIFFAGSTSVLLTSQQLQDIERWLSAVWAI